MMREKLQSISPMLSLVNAVGTALVIAFLTLYVGLPSQVAVHAKSISQLELESTHQSDRLSSLEQSGTITAKDHIKTDEDRQLLTDQRLLEHEKMLRTNAETLATILERLNNVIRNQEAAEKRQEQLLITIQKK